ncbi:MAG: MFS transporter [Spirochaetaceae bacterium]|nr:MAG: MFS transporter [Spirochaetaceae bacterium]
MAANDREYRKRIRAWTMYDWANSAFITTVAAAVLPVYYSQVAASTLPSPAVATAYWSAGLSISLLIVAVIAPVLGTVSDVMRGKKMFLSIFAGIGVVATGLLVLVKSGNWLLASFLFIFGRIGFAGANVFYDALLPHVASIEDQDKVSSRGYAMGYLGGGLLLALNVVMIQLLPGTWGPRLSFLSVALWWALFSVPLLKKIPEPHTLTARLDKGQNVLSISFKRIAETFRDIRQYKELFKLLLAALIYLDGIGTIIGVAAIYGAELGFGTLELILALLLVQFVGIPFSLIFGRLPGRDTRHRHIVMAFIIFNIVLLPVIGIGGKRLLPGTISGAPLPAYTTTQRAVGEGAYPVTADAFSYRGSWTDHTVAAETIRTEKDRIYRTSEEQGARLDFSFNGQRLTITYGEGPEHGIWNVVIDGLPLEDEDGKSVAINAYSANQRYENTVTVQAPTAGEHMLSLLNQGEKDPRSAGNTISVAEVKVLPPLRQSNLGLVIVIILALEVLCLLLALLLGKLLFSRLAEKMNTKRSLLLALLVYSVIAVWGFFLDSVVEFWCLAWLVACVQGGSQALTRSLFSTLIPAPKSGEFFGLFGIMEKVATIFGPLLFAAAAALFGSSRPAVLSLIVFFIVGIVLLMRVDVERGRYIARAEETELKSRLE